MRSGIFRLSPSATSWIAIAITICLSSGCQKWSLRQNMGAFFGGEVKDDWEPPVKAPKDSTSKDEPSDTATNRTWWGKRSMKGVPRVILPRDRKLAEAKPPREIPSDAPQLPRVSFAPESQAAPSQPTSPPSIPNPSTPNIEKNESKPKGEIVAFGPNPNSAAGKIIPPQPEGTGPAEATPNLMDTGVQDLDLEASLQTLPPQYRDVVMRTLEAVKQGKSIEKMPPPTATGQEKSELLASQPAPSPIAASLPAASLPAASQPAASLPAASLPAASQLAASQPAASQPAASQAVSVRLTEASITALPAPNTAPEVAVAIADTTSPGSVVQSSANVPASNVSNTGVATTPHPKAAVQAAPVPASPAATASAPAPNAPVPAVSAAATTMVTSPKATTWHAMVSDAIERLESELESKPIADESLRRSHELTLRMLYVAQRRLDDALRPIERMEPHEQEYVRHQMQALYEASNPDANPARARHWSTVMMSQREATAHLAAVSNLEVRSVVFCTQVDGYGTYQKFPKSQFTPDQDVLLYCEIDNVAAVKVKGGFETQLQGSYEIRDTQGRLVVDQELPMEPEVCMNHRRDYFMVYRIYIPSQIAPGNYELRLTIQDKKGGKYGHSNASFEVRK
jgi:hypothetical protein